MVMMVMVVTMVMMVTMRVYSSAIDTAVDGRVLLDLVVRTAYHTHVE